MCEYWLPFCCIPPLNCVCVCVFVGSGPGSAGQGAALFPAVLQRRDDRPRRQERGGGGEHTE